MRLKSLILNLIIFCFLMTVASANSPKLWKVGNEFLTPKCFTHEWISSDNLKAVNEHYSKKIPKDEKFEFSKIGSYYEKYIPLEDSFDPKFGDRKMLSLTRYLKDCGSAQPVNVIMQLDNSFQRYEIVQNPKWDDPKIACRILAPFISAKCLDIKTVKFTVGFSGSMPPYSQVNIYGVYELKNKNTIVLPLSFDAKLPEVKKAPVVLRGDFFSWVSSQTEHQNMNALYYSDQFNAYVKKTYSGFVSALDYSMKGPGDGLNYNDSKRYVWGSACRVGECGLSKSFIWLDTKEKKSIAMTTNDLNLTIVTNDYDQLPKEFVNAVKNWIKENYSHRSKTNQKITSISFQNKSGASKELNLNTFN